MRTTLHPTQNLRHVIRLRYSNGNSVNLSSSQIRGSIVRELGGEEIIPLIIENINLNSGEFALSANQTSLSSLIPGISYYYDALVIHPEFTTHTETYKLVRNATATQL